MAKSRTTVVSVRLPNEIVAVLHRRAENETKSLNRVVQDIVQREVAIDLARMYGSNEKGRATNSAPISANGAK